MSVLSGYEMTPARIAAQRSMMAVESGDRGSWLSLFAEDAVVQDPVGVSPLDPTGAGHFGADAIAAFYDNVISAGQVRFAIEDSYAAGDECANVGTITTTFPDGSTVEVDLVSLYQVNREGRITSLRAFWEFDKARVTPAS